MDFGSILYTAQKNDQNSRQSDGWYKTGFAPPKKEQRDKKLSVNIQKFLARKEEEEKRKKLEAERKKQELLALRSKDKKSVKRVQSMLKRTKSANKSVLEDAIDYENTAVTAAGPLQPDEDDYGYVSKDAEELYNKLINKYNSAPSDNSLFQKSSNKTAKEISNTKDRVKAALQREEDEKLLPRKRKRKSKDGDEAQASEGEDSNDDISEKKTEEKPKSEKFKIPKKNSQGPPPIDFQSLLKLAEQKQHEPIIIEKTIEDKPDRPMTQKEKLEYMRERERKMRREMQVTTNNKLSELPVKKEVKFKSTAPSSNSSVSLKTGDKRSQKDRSELISKPVREPDSLSSPEPTFSSAHKSALPSNRERSVVSGPKKPITKDIRTSNKPKLPADKLKSIQKPDPSDRIRSNGNGESSKFVDKPRPQPNKTLSDSQKAMLMKKAREQYFAEQRKNVPSKLSAERKDRDKPVRVAEKSSKIPEKRDIKPMERKPIPSSQSQVKKFPPRDEVRQFPPRDMVKQFPPPDMIRKKPPPRPIRRQVIESDDEYDSEMDDFIDDSEDPNDVSTYISEIFGYDRRRYAGIDEEDDEECMESNFSELQKEEFMSTKYGIMEDLADVRRTKLEKERKKKRIMSR